ncbi:MAG TPA: hypothetical protein VK184_23505 [Nostocaceae cyanobacterium]|nr:hypothetical protein [Nostocaceae cyanobacterium]
MQITIAITPSELKDLIREAVRQELAAAQPLKKTDDDQWVDTSPAYALIGFESAEQLRKCVRNGLFRQNIEFRDRRLNGREKPKYQFNIKKCKQRLLTPPEERDAPPRQRKNNQRKSAA